MLYNFETKNADWREGFQCWLDNVKKKPFELKLSFEGSWGAAPFKENIEKELISPLAHTRDEYQKEFKPAIAFHELPKITSSQDQELQKLLNSTQTTLLNKRISVAHGTGAFSFLSVKDYGNLHLKISSTGDNCLIINGKNSCQIPINFAKNPFKS